MENPSREELEKLLEKAKREQQALLDRMTPEEREAAERRAKQMIEEDQANMQKLIEDAAAVAGSAPKKTNTPGTCPHCGAPAEGGKFCAYCGSPLTAEDNA